MEFKIHKTVENNESCSSLSSSLRCTIFNRFFPNQRDICLLFDIDATYMESCAGHLKMIENVHS